MQDIYIRFMSNGDGTCSVVGIENFKNTTEIIVPNKAPNGDSVTSIGSRAFFCCKGLTSITIPDSVTSIGSEAFSSCKVLFYLQERKNERKF